MTAVDPRGQPGHERTKRREPPPDAVERELLSGWLDYFRETVVMKLDGLDREQVTRRLVPSQTTLLSIVKHLTYAEELWFSVTFAGRDPRHPRSDDEDLSFRIGPEESADSVVATYRAECTRSRAVVASAADLSDRAAAGSDTWRGRTDRFTLRWILTHMIEETARHAGHADILRELIDGTAGK